MAVDVDGPVGVARPGLRRLTKKVTNFGSDQEKVVKLLAAIPALRGGKKETFALLAFVFIDGKCDPRLAEAIFDFQQFWKAKGFFQNIDGVVDPGMNTIKKLNELADEKPNAEVADIIIRFIGGTFTSDLFAEGVFPGSRIPSYQSMDTPFKEAILQHPADGRALIRVGRTTGTIGSASAGMFSSVRSDLDSMLASIGATPSKIYIYGSSGGGNNAIDFAQQLAASAPRFPVHFLAVMDAAFFDPDTQVKPKTEGRDPGAVPLFRVASTAAIKHNFFQTLGNHARTTKLGLGTLVFFSAMFNEEIHGEIEGFTSHNLDDKMQSGRDDASLHGDCIEVATPLVQGQISDDLFLGRTLPPDVG
jgi:hypothetical protein